MIINITFFKSLLLILLLLISNVHANCNKAKNSNSIVVAGGSITEIIYFLNLQNMIDTFNERLKKDSIQKNSKLCIGLDIDPDRMPNHMDKSLQGIESHLKEIIDSTTEICLAYKLNMAFYEQFGFKGYELMEKIVSAPPSRPHPASSPRISPINSSYFSADRNCGNSTFTLSGERNRKPVSASPNIVVSLYESPAAITR